MKKTLLLSALLLISCMEPQPKPDLATYTVDNFKIETIADNFNTPWSVAVLPNEGYLVTEKEGRLVRLNSDGSRDVIEPLPNDIFTGGQGGLFDVIIAKNFSTTGQIYLSYAYGTEKSNGTALIEATLNGNNLTNTKTVFKVTPSKDTANHFGGRIVLMPDDSLILTLGDGFTYREAAQDKFSYLGKIVRIMPDGSPHTDNPFMANKGHPEIYSYGHRNVQGAALDPKTDTLWTHEHGPRGGDELNEMAPGKNYGWPVATTGTDYSGSKITPHETLSGTEAFTHDWVPSIAPSGLTIYRGDLFKNWDGDALIGSLASKDLRRVDLKNGKAVGEDIILSDLGARVRDVRTDKDGSILLLINRQKDGTDGGGELLRILPR